MYKTRIFLLIFRVFSGLSQYGYIYPDEFFQSNEITAGDIFGFKTVRAWEFNAENPVRSIVFPYITSGISFLALKILPGIDVAANLVLFPRMAMILLSFVNDVLILKICRATKTNTSAALVIFSTSYITFAFYARTFSNTTESLLMTLLLYAIISSRRNSISEYVDFNRMIPVVLAVGIFNRPTFVLFAVSPVAFWLIDATASLKQIIKRLCFAFPLFIFTCFIFVICDSIYYKSLTFDDLGEFSRAITKITLTPLNFVRYNLNGDNLKIHGSHPRYLHFVINFPILFGFSGIVSLVESIGTNDPKKYERILLLASIVVPITSLSVFPHQEPRFIIPVLIPFVIVAGDRIYRSNMLFSLWILHNVLGLLIFGYFHQAGLVPCLQKLRIELRHDASNSTDVIFYKTYMPPQHILALPSDSKIQILDLAGSSSDEFIAELKTFAPGRNLLVITPYTVIKKLLVDTKINFKFRRSFFPHLSIEDLPDFKSLIGCEPNRLFPSLCSKSFIERLKLELSLAIVETKS
ncbi:Uncharacterised protein r2_g4180 [Pycnogonum litorale]